MKKLVGFACFVVFLAIYLNVGWALGTYFYDNVRYSKPQTLVAKILAGPKEGFSFPAKSKEKRTERINEQLMWSALWPLLLAIVTGAWIVQSIVCLVLFAFYAVKTILWLIFTGGIAKLLHVG